MPENAASSPVCTPSDERTAHPSVQEEVSLLEVMAILLRHRWTILMFVIAIPAIVGVMTLLAPHTWTSSTSFISQSSRSGSSSRIQSLAGQFGFDVGGFDAGESPDFYVELVSSREVLGSLVTDTFTVSERGLFSTGERMRGTLAEMLMIDEEPELRRDAVMRWLQEDAVSASAEPETGIVRVAVTTKWPELSAQIAENLIELVNAFNLQTRRSQAAAERQFVEERMESAQQALRESEDALQQFLQGNRVFQDSPELVFEHERLQRRVAYDQQVYMTLADSYEQARIAEVRNTPLITVLEPPQRPVRPDRRRLVVKVLFGLIIGLFLGLVVALSREYVRQTRLRGSPGLREVSELWDETRADVRRLSRWFRPRK